MKRACEHHRINNSRNAGLPHLSTSQTTSSTSMLAATAPTVAIVIVHELNTPEPCFVFCKIHIFIPSPPPSPPGCDHLVHTMTTGVPADAGQTKCYSFSLKK